MGSPAAIGPARRYHSAHERRLHPVRRPNAHRQVRRRPFDRARHRPGGDGHPGRGRTVRRRRRRRSTRSIMGQVIQAGAGQAPARQAALKGGLPEGVSATTINKVCGSGMKAVMLGAASIRAGDAERDRGRRDGEHEPGAVPAARGSGRLPARQPGAGGQPPCTTACGARPATCTWASTPSGWRPSTASRREAQDAFALRSHQRALAAMAGGRFADEIVPVTVHGKKGPTTVDTDEESARGHLGRGPGQAQARLPARWRRHRHRRQRPRHHRWRGGAGPRLVGGRRGGRRAARRWPGSPATPRPTSPRSGCSRRRSRVSSG